MLVGLIGSVIAGAGLRIAHYLSNRALWFDEYMLALNIFSRSYTGLLQPLDHNQGAPLGFLLLEKFSVTVLGPTEVALRLFPLLAGLLALLLFAVLVQRTTDQPTALMATVLFAFSYPLLYYSAETKQYSVDVFVTVFLLAASVYLERWRSPWLSACCYGLMGAGAVWLSHAAVFVLAGILVADGWRTLRQRAWSQLWVVVLPLFFWGPSFVGTYLVSLANLSRNQDLLTYWHDSFLPLPPRSWQDLRLLWRIGVDVFALPLGLALPFVATLGLVRGVWAWRREPLLLRLVLPIGAVAGASALHIYPFRGRLILFVAPLLLLVIAIGLVALWRDGGQSWGLLIPMVVLSAHPIWLAIISRFWPDTWSPACVPSQLGTWIDICMVGGLVIGLLRVHRTRIPRMLSMLLLGTGLLVLALDLRQATAQPEPTCFMPDWKRVAQVIRARRSADEPVVITGWDALPLQRYLSDVPVLLSFQLEEQLTAARSSGAYLLVYSQFSTPLRALGAHEVELVEPAPTVRLTRYLAP